MSGGSELQSHLSQLSSVLISPSSWPACSSVPLLPSFSRGIQRSSGASMSRRKTVGCAGGASDRHSKCHFIAAPDEGLQICAKCAVILDGQGHKAKAKLVKGRPVLLALSALCYLCAWWWSQVCQCVHVLRDDAHIRDNGPSRLEVMDEKVSTTLAEFRETPRVLFSDAACCCGHVAERALAVGRHAVAQACLRSRMSAVGATTRQERG